MKNFPNEKIFHPMTKNVAFFVHNLTDTVISIGNQQYNSITVADLVSAPNSPYFIDAGSDGIPDLCVAINSQINHITGVFSDGTQYELNSVDFVGGHPIHRPK